MKKLSIVICVFNEEENILPLARQIIDSIGSYDFEAIFVDDGSSDSTCQQIRAINDERFVLLQLKKNYGQSAALQAGIDLAEGEFIVTMDGDLQNDPSDIPAMLSMAISNDWDVVAGLRANRKDGTLLRKLPSKIANAIIRRSAGISIKDFGCTLRVYRAEIAKSLRIYGELHRFIPLLVALEGGTIAQMEVTHHARIHGKSKYGLGRTLRVMSDLLVMLFMKRYLHKPMHLFGGLGFLALGVGVIINLYLFALKMAGHDIWGKPLLILGVLFLLGGIQLITIGLLAEIQMRTYFESQNKKPYRIRKIEQVGQSEL